VDWLNIHIAKQIRSPAAIGSAPAELGTWVRVLAYCCEQENGGRIVGGAAWKDRQWQQTCAVTLRELRSADRLVQFDGDDVVVNGYPVEKEAEVQRARRRASAGAMARWGHRSGTSSGNAQADARADAEGEREVGRGKGREGEAATAAPAAPAPPADQDPFHGEPQAVTKALSAQTYMDWKNRYRAKMGFDPQRGASDADWAAVFHRNGWDDMCLAMDHLIKQITDPRHKVWPDQIAKLEKDAP
jgi:hypothetical protein